jgi:rhamnose transport system ATP-binding protein
LAGLVGSGRSELAQAVFGITPARSGTIAIEGAAVRIDSPAAAKQLGIAYVPEDRATQGLVRPMTVRENASLAVLRQVARSGFIDASAEAALAEDAVRTFSIRTAGIEQVAGRLSGGNQQKIVLSKWLATRPRVLMLDEPTRGIDVGAKAEIHRLMGELAGQGLAILMISSELPEVLGMSDRVLVVREGRIAAEFARAEATPERVGAAMMGGDGLSGA